MEEKKEAVKDFEDEDVEKAIELCEKAIEIVLGLFAFFIVGIWVWL